VCERHHCTAMMSAIRYDEIDLVEWIVRQTKECDDIDIENIYGDTALIIAGKLGKLDMMQLLIQHGADINKETSSGKTALIEAVKSQTERIEVIEELIKAGAVVSYKTKKHLKTAIDWGRLMQRPATVRILELSAVVQMQTKIIFTSISIGDFETVKKIIADGDFF